MSRLSRPGVTEALGWACLAFVAAVVPGCMVGPDYAPPDVEVNDAWLEMRDGSVAADPDVDARWWRCFDDPVLDELVDEALRQNLTLRIAGVRVLQSMAARGIAVGQLFPQTQEVGASFSRERISENPTPPSEYVSQYGAGFDAVWELDFWGRFRRSIEASDADLDAALASYDTVTVSLLSEVALAYVDIRTLQRRLVVARRNVELQEKSLSIATERFEAGDASELDATQARSLLEETRAAIPGFESQLDGVVYRLGVLLGRPPRDLIERLGEGEGVPVAPDAIAVGVPADLLRRRPDVRVAERQAAAASARIGVAEADVYPAFRIAGSIGYASDSTGSLLDSDSWTGLLTPSVTLPFLDYGRIRNNVRVSDADYQAAVINYRNSVLSAAAEVETGLSAFAGSRRQLDHLVRSVSASERAVEISTEQYREGEADFTRVLDSLESLASLRDRLAQARGQVATNLITTYKALGGGWEVRRGIDVVPDETRREMAERTDWGELLDPDYPKGKDLGLIERHDPSEGVGGGVRE